MPDLTIEYMQQCIEQGCRSSRWAQQGGCWPFKKTGNCKHMCGWHEIVGDPPQNEVERENMECPKCGGRTEWVRVGV